MAPAVAHAAPCEGRLPSRYSETVSGVVRYIGDGDSPCLGPSANPAMWIEVRPSDFDAPEFHGPTGRTDRDHLSRLVRSRFLACVAVRGRNGRAIVYDRVIAPCRLNGRRGGDLLRVVGGWKGGN